MPTPVGPLSPTDRIEADTEAWRADADRILGYWHERLIADRDTCIITTELWEDFNRWLRRNGHGEWSKELFHPRFAQHDKTVSHGIDVRKPRQAEGVSRSGFPSSTAATARPYVYQGVRFQTPSDQEEHESGPTGTTFSEHSSYACNGEKLPNGQTGQTTHRAEAGS
jgi:putative DNA primase/helicase